MVFHVTTINGGNRYEMAGSIPLLNDSGIVVCGTSIFIIEYVRNYTKNQNR